MGLSFDAFAAGQLPKSTPMSAQNASAARAPAAGRLLSGPAKRNSCYFGAKHL